MILILHELILLNGKNFHEIYCPYKEIPFSVNSIKFYVWRDCIATNFEGNARQYYNFYIEKRYYSFCLSLGSTSMTCLRGPC